MSRDKSVSDDPRHHNYVLGLELHNRDSIAMTENEIDLEALSTTEPGRIAPTAQQALARIEAAVDYHLREMDEVFGAEPPTPLTEQNYSGRFLVRTSRALHARLILEAAEQGVSLNQWVAQKLADRKPDLDW